VRKKIALTLVQKRASAMDRLAENLLLLLVIVYFINHWTTT
jgi:hypothetical protein